MLVTTIVVNQWMDRNMGCNQLTCLSDPVDLIFRTGNNMKGNKGVIVHF